MTSLTTEHGDIFLTVDGPDDGLPVVFTHGLTMDHRTFASQIEALRGTYRRISWDLPGHGKSFPLTAEKFRFAFLTEVLLDLLDTLKVERAVLVGQSVSSLLHQYVAWHHPTRVAALVDIGSLPLHKPMSKPMLAMGKLGVSMSALLPEKAFYAWFANARSITPQTRAYMVQGIHAFGKRAVIEMTHAYFKDQAEGIPGPPDAPLLIVNGDQEMSVVRKPAIQWAAEVGARRVVVPDAGHIANQDNPDSFNALLLEFLDNL